MEPKGAVILPADEFDGLNYTGCVNELCRTGNQPLRWLNTSPALDHPSYVQTD